MYRVALALGLLSSEALAGPCAVIPNEPVILTPDKATIPADGGIVVALEPAYHPTPGGPTPPLDTWTFGDGRKVRPVHLAPGLETVPVTGATATLKWVTVGAGKRAPLAAPKVVQVAVKTAVEMRHSSTTVTATFADVPAGVIAVVAFDKTGAAKSWAIPSGKTAAIYATGGCTTSPNGTTPTNRGETITLAFVDDGGRMSAPSTAVTVQ